MTATQAKIILQEFDRLNLEIVAGINLLDEHGIISNHCSILPDIANEDGDQCIEFLKRQPAPQ